MVFATVDHPCHCFIFYVPRETTLEKTIEFVRLHYFPYYILWFASFNMPETPEI